jgi:hypothetical protein
MFKTVQKNLLYPFGNSRPCVPNRNLRDFNFFYVDVKRRNCPAARGAAAVNSVSTDIGIFNGRSVFTNDLLDADIFTKQMKILNIFYAADLSPTLLLYIYIYIYIFFKLMKHAPSL